MSAAAARILVVDDENPMRHTIVQALRAAEFRVLEASDGAAGLECALQQNPDLVVLDVMMPRLTGFEVAAELRRLGKAVPILMLTTRQEIGKRLEGFAAGADDYLAKPFDARELVARVRALLKRRDPAGATPRRLVFGALTVDLDRHEARRGAAGVKLTPTEWSLLELFAAHLGAPVSRELMLDSIWGYTYFPSTRTIDTHIWRLRAKLGDGGDQPKWIQKVPGQGYLLHSSAAAAAPV